MKAYAFETTTLDGAGEERKVDGRVDAENFDAALALARRETFLALTSGRATFGRPGEDGCRGPYETIALSVRRLDR